MKVTEIAIKRPAFITMVFSALAVLGLYSYTQMSADFLPKIAWPMAFVTVPYPGAGPQEVESEISKPIEEALSSLSGLKSLRTYSNENVSFTWIEYSMSTNIDIAINDVDRKINSIRNNFPEGVLEPRVSKVDINATPILRLAALSQMQDEEFYQFVKDKIVPRLEQVIGVATVSIVGGKQREIRIEVDNDKLKAYSISIGQVSQKLAAENIDFPAGKIDQKVKRYIIRVSGKLTSLDAIRNVIILNTQAGPVYLKDVATVIDTYKENYTLGRLNTTSCIGLVIQKSSDANAIKCRDKIMTTLSTVQQEHGDRGVSFTVAQDITEYTRDSLDEVRRDMGLAICMVAMVLFLFLHNVRNSLIVLLSIPTSIITAVTVMYLLGFTLNMVTLMALTLVIGILVDDSIVVLENVHRHLETGQEPRIAALRGRSEIGLAAIAITLVDVVVFAPISMLSGVVGKVFKEFGITVVAATLVSLAVSFTLTPMLASRWSRIVHYRKGSFVKKIVDTLEGGQSMLNRSYGRLLQWALSHKTAVIAVSILLFGASVALIPLGFVGAEFMPSIDRGEFAIGIELPLGTNIEKTNEMTLQIEEMIQKIPEVKQYYTIVGRSEGAHSNAQRPNISQLQIKLHTGKKVRRTQEVIEEILKKANALPGVEVKASLIGLFGAADETPISIELKAEELELLIPASQQVMDLVKQTSGTRDVRSSWEEGQPELKVSIDRQKCGQYNLSVAEVGLMLRNAFEGDITTKYTESGIEYDMRVLLSSKNRINPEDVGRLSICNRFGQTVTLDEIAVVSISKGPSEIARKDRGRIITILSNLNGTRPLGDVTVDIEKKIKGLKLPSGITVFFGGDVENMQDMQKDMMKAIGF
ncbi:MAG: efflux RND transporter permease subunit, partial [Chitinivibrionales bacterium]|nr:efflux RND transporter permease subunit [Chitinivibrionales bacterium]